MTRLTVAAAVVLLCSCGLALTLDDDSPWNVVAATVPKNSVSTEMLDARPVTGTTVYLVVGSDRRPASPDTVYDVRGERADAIMLVAVRASGTLGLLSVPRDVRVHVPGHGDGKVGGALSYGRPALIEAVRAVTGLPVHHYVELDFAAVTAIADTLGGIAVTLPRPARDTVTGLDLPAGRHRLDGSTALAFVRSRHYEERYEGTWTTEGYGDLGRITRQHQLLTGILEAFQSRCVSLICAGLLQDLSRVVTVDQGFDGDDLRRVTAAVRSADSGEWMSTLPTRVQRPAEDSMSPFPPAHPGNVVYRVPDRPAATTAVAQLMGAPPAAGR